jgi:hypothetical protein
MHMPGKASVAEAEIKAKSRPPVMPIIRPIVALTGSISAVTGQIIAVVGRTRVIRPKMFTVAMISRIAAAVAAIAAVVDVDSVAVACGIDLYRHRWHGLA